MAIRQAHARWDASLKSGSGKVDVGRSLSAAPYLFASKVLAGAAITLEAALRAR